MDMDMPCIIDLHKDNMDRVYNYSPYIIQIQPYVRLKEIYQ